MAREIENLEIVIDVLAKTGEIDRLLTALADLKLVAEGLDDIRIKVHVDDSQLDAALGKLVALNMGETTGGGLGGGGFLPVGNLSGIAQMDIEDNMVRALDETNSQLAHIAFSNDEMIRMMRHGDFIGGGGRGGAISRFAVAAENATEGMGGLNLRMSDMHNALAKIIPVLLVAIGTLPALITALVAVAAAAIAAALALGAIGAIGVIGALAARSGTGRPTSEAFQEMMTELTDGIIDALLPLGRRFAPLAERALEGIIVLMERIEMVAGRALIGLTDDAEAFGRFMMEFIPNAIRNMARMAEAFGPIFGMIADFLLNTGFLQPLTELFAAMLPDLVVFMALLGKMLPALIKFSIGLLHAFNIMLIFFDILMTISGALGISAEEFGVLVGVVLILVSAIAILNTVLVKNLLATLAGMTVKTVGIAIGQFYGLAAAKISAALAAVTLANAVRVLTVAILGLLAVSGIGILLSVLGTMTAGFLKTSGAIDKATASLKEFDKYGGNGSGFNPYAPPSGATAGTGGRNVTVAPTLNIDNRGMNKEDSDVQTRNTLWRMRRGI